MSLIPYPNVPPLPGVPAINRNSAGYVGAALNIAAQLLPNNLFGTKCYKWFIKTKSSRDGYRYIEESKFLELSAKAFSADAGQTHFKLLFNFIMYTFRYTPKIEFVIQSTGKLLYRCRITELKVVKEIQIVRRMEKPKIPIPDWCPLDDLDPKFVDV